MQPKVTDIPPMRPNAILFDWDNTLVDTFPVVQDALNHTFAVFGMAAWSDDDIKERVRQSLRDSFPGLFGADWERARDVFYERFLSIHKDRLEVFDGAEALLEYLGTTDIYIGVVSNKTGRYLRDEINHLGWTHYFDRVVGATDAAYDKPDPAVITMALSGSGIRPGADVWMVGDTDIDMECSHKSGLTGVLVREEPPKADEFPDCGPKWHFGDCYSFCNFVQNL